MRTESRGDDEYAIRCLLRGDKETFTAIYRKCSGPVYRFALYMTGEAHMAEEITQETFLFLLANAASYSAARGSLLAWLLGIARNMSRRAVAAGSETEALDDDAGIDIADNCDLFENFARREMVQAVRRVVESLPPLLREVVILCELQELDYKDAASVLGCPVGTVRSRLNRARALLTSKLKAGCSA